MAAYVRINRAGVRVRAEERAFAALIRHVPQTSVELRRYSEAREERMWRGAGSAGNGHDRRWLAHATERSFGFSLWMRAVVRDLTIALAPGSATKPAWQSADVIERWTIQDRLAKPKEAERERILAAPKRASRILLTLDHLLSEYLRLDNPMALPDARAFLPIIDLFARHDELLSCAPESEHSRDVVLGNVLLWLMAHPYLSQSDIADLLKAAASPGGAAVAIDAMVRVIHDIYLEDTGRSVPSESLESIVKKTIPLVGVRFDLQRRQARTLRDRTVGFLYGIERRMRDSGRSRIEVAASTAWRGRPFAPPSTRRASL